MTSSRRRSSRWGIVTAALGLFLVVFALLAVQMRAQGGGSPVAAAPERAPARRVLVRRVVTRTVVVHVRREDGGGTRAVRVAVPVTAQTSTPAARPGPAPAPAPPPAPLVSRTS
jgi:hypothetical protein